MALAALFLLFSVGMTCMSLEKAFKNLTEIERLNKKTKVWSLALYPSIFQKDALRRYSGTDTYRNHHQLPLKTRTHRLTNSSSDPSDLADSTDSTDSSSQEREFIIVHSIPGQNIFDRGWSNNFMEVMGTNVFDWLLPIRYSPRAPALEDLPEVALIKNRAGLGENFFSPYRKGTIWVPPAGSADQTGGA